jgi:hypothetical protein
MGYSSIIDSISMVMIDLFMILVGFNELVIFLLVLVAGFLVPFFAKDFEDVLLICFNSKSITYLT